MPRIRYLKPDFFKDEHIKDLPYEARLFYQGLWCYADKKGRLEDRPERLKVEIMPYDKIDIEKILTLLSSPKKNSKRPYILRYSINKENYIQILQWHKHQKPHHTEQESTIPEPSKDILEPLNNGCLSVVTQEGMGMEKGMEKIKSKGEDKDTATDFLQSLKTNTAYSHINIDTELGKMDGWLLAHPNRQKTKRFIVNWLNKIERPLDIKKPIKPQPDYKAPDPKKKFSFIPDTSDIKKELDRK